MIVVLNQICVSITKSPELLEFCFDISAEHGPSRFVIFSLLIPFVHRDGLTGKKISLNSIFFSEKSMRFIRIRTCFAEPTYIHLDTPSIQGITTGGPIRYHKI